jgi:hypothetical protein
VRFVGYAAGPEFLIGWVTHLIRAGGYNVLPDDSRRIAQGVRALLAFRHSIGHCRNCGLSWGSRMLPAPALI